MSDDAGWDETDRDTQPSATDGLAEEREAADGGQSEGVTVRFEGDTPATVEPNATAADGDGEEEGAVAGSFAPDLEVTPGSPHPENVVFVALGVYIATLAVGRMFVGASIYTPATFGAITLGVAAGTALLYGLLTRTNPDT